MIEDGQIILDDYSNIFSLLGGIGIIITSYNQIPFFDLRSFSREKYS